MTVVYMQMKQKNIEVCNTMSDKIECYIKQKSTIRNA